MKSTARRWVHAQIRPRIYFTPLRVIVLVAAALSILTPTAAVSSPTFTVIKTIDVDFNPFGITTSPDGQTVWVANSGGVEFLGGVPSNKITIIDIPSLTKEPTKVTVGSFPEHIAFTADGSHAAVTNANDATVSIVDAEARAVSQTVSIGPLGLAYPAGVIFNKSEKRIFVSTGGGFDDAIAVLDSRNIGDVQLAGTVPYAGFPGIPALDPKSHQLLVPASPPFAPSPTGDNIADLLVIDPNSGHILHDLAMPITNAFANDIAVAPDGRFAYISIFAFSGGVGGVWVVDLKRLKTVTMIDTGDPSVLGTGITPDGRYIFATNFRDGDLAVIDPRTRDVIATIPVGTNPNEVAVSLDGTEAFVTNQGDTTVSVVSIPQEA
jgi:YVTN family beta-propeller protein